MARYSTRFRLDGSGVGLVALPSGSAGVRFPRKVLVTSKVLVMLSLREAVKKYGGS